MKKLLFIAGIFGLLLFNSCKDDEPKTTQVIHEGEKWNITSVEYTVIDQQLPFKNYVDTGTKSNAGAFYFNGGQGSFDIDLGGAAVEDYFSYEESAPDISVTSITQNVNGAAISQNVITISGTIDSNTMTLDGTIVKQNTSGQFSLVATFELTKE